MIIGYIGLIALAACWVPQTLQTIKEKDCKANMLFLILNFIGSVSLVLYAVILKDAVFSILNFMTSIGALINILYKIRATKAAV
jgi:uncharacterized protein with PQ loop repeat